MHTLAYNIGSLCQALCVACFPTFACTCVVYYEIPLLNPKPALHPQELPEPVVDTADPVIPAEPPLVITEDATAPVDGEEEEEAAIPETTPQVAAVPPAGIGLPDFSRVIEIGKRVFQAGRGAVC